MQMAMRMGTPAPSTTGNTETLVLTSLLLLDSPDWDDGSGRGALGTSCGGDGGGGGGVGGRPSSRGRMSANW